MKTSIHTINFVFVIFSLLLHIKTVISLGHQLADANGAINKCSHKERHALLDFKAHIEDPATRLLTWRAEDDDCCKWSGVTCNKRTSRVTKLDLTEGPLGGEISPSLLNLTSLNHLDLSSNMFNGAIPKFIGSMTRLTYLDLHGNYFNGTIPKSIGSLTQLRYLDLSDNFLHGFIPPELGNLTNLQNLLLGISEKSTVENLDWLSNLSNLQQLQLDMISLGKANHWVDVILSLQNLTYLSLWGCDLSEVMHPYSSFVNTSSSSSIGFLSLGNNNLNSSMYRWLFPLIGNKLVNLDLSNNMLDRIPKYLGNLCSLTSLSLYGNSVVANFSDVLNNLSGCTSVTLQDLDVSDNQLTGSLSNEIHKFSSLVNLVLSHNQLNGIISEKVWGLPNLEILDVSFNSLRGGVISQNIGKSKLWKIDLSSNLLEVIPSKAHNLSYVKYLDLSGCKVGPLFPEWIQTFKNLTHLNIANTRLSDTIPVEFWNLWPSRLTYLNLSSNNISGELPDLSSNFDDLSTIDLSSNKFYGPIPDVHPTLLSLNLSKNKFYGGISFLCQIVDGFLSFLDLSHNSLIGQIPDCLWHFKQLKVLNLGDNSLSGRIPASIGYLAELEVLHLYNNNFSGELPLALKNCMKLNFLNLGANKFFGNVPVWVGEKLTLLYGFSLRSNNFFGPIPLQLCYLVNLQILDLSINNLDGSIPSCVNNLTSMVRRRFLPKNNMHGYGKLYDEEGDITMVGTYVDYAIIEWQGNEHEITSTLRFLMSIDLSSNNLTGQIPNELTDLRELVALDLSKNALLGEIPRKIGEMKKLLTLDLSRNKFSGVIPSSMSGMSLLNYLDVSYNNLSGRIPSSTQLQSFEPSSYTGNAGLCGPPITKNCQGDEESEAPPPGESEGGAEGIDELWRWFLIGGGTGFVTGFWIACGTLLLNRHGRHVLFHFVDFLKDWVYVKVVVLIRKLQKGAYT